MPIYEYHCSACGHQFEALQKVTESALVDCPACARPELRKKLSAPAFRLSGGGWYETDFKTDKDKKRNLAGDKTADSEKSGDRSAQPSPTTDTAKATSPSTPASI